MPVADFALGVKDSSYWMSHLKSISAHPKNAAQTADAKPASTTTTASTDSGESFGDRLLDVINPLQHLPVVSTIYRAVTGDKIGDVEKVAGDTLYGGPLGLASSLADLAFEKITGKDFGSTVMSALGLEHDDDNTALAANTDKKSAAPAAKTVVADTKPTPSGPLFPATAAPLLTATAAPTTLSKLAAQPVTTAPVTAIADKTASIPATKPQPGVIDISSNTDALLSALARNGVTGDMQAQAMDAYRRTMSMNSSAITPSVN